MAKLSLQIPHSLGTEVAISRLRAYLGTLEAEHSDFQADDEFWNGNQATYTFRTPRFSSNVAMVVEEDAVEFEGEIPFAATFFRGKIEEFIRDRLMRALAE